MDGLKYLYSASNPHDLAAGTTTFSRAQPWTASARGLLRDALLKSKMLAAAAGLKTRRSSCRAAGMLATCKTAQQRRQQTKATSQSYTHSCGPPHWFCCIQTSCVCPKHYHFSPKVRIAAQRSFLSFSSYNVFSNGIDQECCELMITDCSLQARWCLCTLICLIVRL